MFRVGDTQIGTETLHTDEVAAEAVLWLDRVVCVTITDRSRPEKGVI